MSARDGGAAFPALNYIVPKDLEEKDVRRVGESRGMTLRDYFAAEALKLVQADVMALVAKARGVDLAIAAAAFAYELADAMLAERAKER